MKEKFQCGKTVTIIRFYKSMSVRIIFEDVLGAVPVMYIPVEDQDTLDAVSFLRVTRCDDDVVE